MSTYLLEKQCRKCGVTKPLEEFYVANNIKCGRKSICAVCERNRTARWRASAGVRHKHKARARYVYLKYNLTEQEYDSLLRQQDYKCAICKTDQTECLFQKLHVDHCHTTGKVRGLLCHSCNNGLGKFKDNAESLQSAISYLEKFK